MDQTVAQHSRPAVIVPHRTIVFVAALIATFIPAVESSIVATALPAIASGLGEIERASWVVVSYLIANTIAAPVYGRLGDTFGRRGMMIFALAIFMLGSVLCALSPNIEFLTAARVLQGFGGGGLMTLSQALIGEAIQAIAPGATRCEIALSVRDTWQRRGLGTRLLRNMECRARMLGARFLIGDVLRTNAAMKGLARKLGFAITSPFTDARLVEIVKDLSMPQSGPPCGEDFAPPPSIAA